MAENYYDQYRQQSFEEVQEEDKKVSEITGNKRNRNWLNFKPGGYHTMKWFPAHANAESTKFLYAKVVSWLPQPIIIDGKDQEIFINPDNEQEVREKLQKSEYRNSTKRKPIFNSKMHGNTQKDLVEEYIRLVVKKLGEEIQDKSELKKKLFSVTDFKTGISPQNSYVGYVKMKINDEILLGPLDITTGVRENMKSSSKREEAGRPIQVDIYSHPVEGMPIQIIYNKGHKDRSKVYEFSLLPELKSKFILTEEDLEWLEKQDSLESMFNLPFKRSDFEKQMIGLEILDKVQEFGIFEEEEWVEVVKEIDSYYPDDEEEESDDEDGNPDQDQNDINETFKSDQASLFAEFKREDLEAFIKANELPYIPRKSHSDETVVEEIIACFDEMEVSASEIPTFIKDFVMKKGNTSSTNKESKRNVRENKKEEEKKTDDESNQLDKLAAKYSR